MLSGVVFDVQHFTLHDGPGIRTSVFLQGCPLRCVWCHNPEGCSRDGLLSCLPERCIGCGACAAVCEKNALALRATRIYADREKCIRCGVCACICPTRALEWSGRQVTVSSLLPELLQDRLFFMRSSGGVTLTGGEPFYQAAFTIALLHACKEAGLHTAVETSGYCEKGILVDALPFTDLFLYDIKETNPLLHQKYVGAPLQPILDNLETLVTHHVRMILRCPIIPGMNERESHLKALAALSSRYAVPCQLLPYHALGESKRRRFGLPEPALIVSGKTDLAACEISFRRAGGILLPIHHPQGE